MMKHPPHPGELLREDVLAELGLSVKDAAARLAVSQNVLSSVLQAQAAISPSLALRLEQSGIGTARAWLAMQSNYDLAQALLQEQPLVRPLFEGRSSPLSDVAEKAHGLP